MRRNLGVIMVACAALAVALMGTVGVGVADAGPVPPGLPAAPVGAPTPSAPWTLTQPLSQGWVASLNFNFPNYSSTPVLATDSGPTGTGGTTGANVVQASMTGARGAYSVQVAIPLGQTIQMNHPYTSYTDQASIVASWPGGGCASSGYGGATYFVVNQLTRGTGGSTTAYAVQFFCSSSTGFVDGALANSILPTTGHQGYYTFGPDGSISGFGNDSYLSYLGILAATPLNSPIVGMATTPDGGGYWMVGSDGGIFAFGDAGFYGSMGGQHLNQPITGMAKTSDGKGYWLVASDGGIFAFGDAVFQGSMGAKHLNQPIVGITSSLDGGYRLVASDGGIFAFGNAPFYGSMGATPLNQPIVGMTGTPTGKGYWMVASDGGIFAFGDAGFYGSTGSIPLNVPVVGMVGSADGQGYWLAGGDGGVFAFGDAPFYGSIGSYPVIGFINATGITT